MADAGYHITEDVGPRTKVGVKNEEEISTGAGEGVSEISCLLEFWSIVAANVVETIGCGQAFDRIHTAVVQNPDLDIGVVNLGDIFVRVFEDFEGLLAAGQVDVNRWIFFTLLNGVFFYDSFVLLTSKSFPQKPTK